MVLKVLVYRNDIIGGVGIFIWILFCLKNFGKRSWKVLIGIKCGD